MATLPNCLYSLMEIPVGVICVEAADQQGLWRKNMPTVGDWVRSNWYVFFALALIVVLAIIGIALSAVRWCRRIEHRHRREERNKRVDGMLRLASASFRGTLSRRSSASSSRKNSDIGDDNSDNRNGCGSTGGFSRTSSRRHTDNDDANEDVYSSTKRSSGAPNGRHYGRPSDDGDEGELQAGRQQNSRSASVEGPQRASSRALTGDVQPRRAGRRSVKLLE
jgi:hypothetical protein